MIIFQYCFTCSVLILHFSLCIALQASLYDKEDPLTELDPINFNRTVLGNNQAWIIEFYSSWCGHCQKFAPVWKDFARNIENWKNVIQVGVVNCADPQNANICRQYDVSGYPTIKIFWHHINASDPGEALDGPRDVESLENFIINFLRSNWNKGVPSTWPQLEDVKSLNYEEITESKPVQSVFLFIEQPTSLVGQKVILDFSRQDNIMVKRALASNMEIMQNFPFVSNNSLPLVVKLFKDNKAKQFLSFEGKNESYIRDRVFKRLLGRPRIDLHVYPHFQNRTPTAETIVDGVYLVDLENAVYYSLSQEIGVVKNIEGEKISALKAYLSVLTKYFPGSEPEMKYLSQLHSWLSYKIQAVTGESFIAKMNELQGEDQYFPVLREWVGCKGSSPEYRGYPCSLWTLFHTLTVQADGGSPGTNADPGEVLAAIKDYIRNFFTCKECVENFFKMDADMSEPISSSQDAVLWIWEAHNKVNLRLAGDKSEDPLHPKVQFPPEKMCSQCRFEQADSTDIEWNRPQVLEFLRSHYSKGKIASAPQTSGSHRGRAFQLSSVLAAVLLYVSQHILLSLQSS